MTSEITIPLFIGGAVLIGLGWIAYRSLCARIDMLNARMDGIDERVTRLRISAVGGTFHGHMNATEGR